MFYEFDNIMKLLDSLCRIGKHLLKFSFCEQSMSQYTPQGILSS